MDDVCGIELMKDLVWNELGEVEIWGIGVGVGEFFLVFDMMIYDDVWLFFILCFGVKKGWVFGVGDLILLVNWVNVVNVVLWDLR